jgi:predicted transcriptional regulator
MLQPPTTKDRQVTFSVASSPAINRLIDELAATLRERNRSEIVRTALIEKADRELPATWRQTVGMDEESAA